MQLAPQSVRLPFPQFTRFTVFGAIFCSLFLLFPLHADEWENALTAFEAKKYESAEKIVDKELSQNDKSPRALILKGRILLARSKFDDAAESFFKALEAKPDAHEAFMYLGDVAFADRQWPYALRFYNTYLSRIKGSHQILLKTIYCKIAMNELAEAGKLITYFSPEDKINPEYYFSRAAFLRSTNKQDDALKLLQQAITLYGQDIFNKYIIDYLWLFKDKEPLQPAKK